MEFIVAVDEQWGIGNQGKMLFHLPQDLIFFKRITDGSIVLMGRKTFESLPNGALPNRVNVVLTNQKDYQPENVIVIHDLAALAKIQAAYPDKPVFLIGGGRLYHDLLDQCEAGYVTVIHGSRQADTHFDNLDHMPNWQCVEILQRGKEGDLAFEMRRYERRKV